MHTTRVRTMRITRSTRRELMRKRPSKHLQTRMRGHRPTIMRKRTTLRGALRSRLMTS